jgi:hypothetical protein
MLQALHAIPPYPLHGNADSPFVIFGRLNVNPFPVVNPAHL